MICIGVDPGSRVMGIGAIQVDGQHMTYLDAGVIDAPAAWPAWKRIRSIGDDLEAWCSELLAKASDGARVHEFRCGLENGFIEKGRQTSLVLAESRGVASFILARTFQVEPRRYAPATIKKAVTTSGNADKEQVARMAKARLGMRRQPGSDTADALAIAITTATDGAR